MKIVHESSAAHEEFCEIISAERIKIGDIILDSMGPIADNCEMPSGIFTCSKFNSIYGLHLKEPHDI